MACRMMCRRSVKLALVALGLLAATAPSAFAGSATANLAVSASVVVNCTITTSPLAFGNYDPVVAHASTNLDADGIVTVACTKGSIVTIGLDTGANASGSTRRMKSGTNYLTYEVYKDTGRTQAWGNSGADLYTTSPAASKNPRDFTAAGRVPANQDIPAGAYTDTVVATVNF
jgi:spore coat protein U-like protein